ncbi:hypothetical protein [Flavihumibacter petaseus]|uniref:Uncharacterized protein n=1 Tax=Flavihumibacter petaseus NBRC 106054 TaxID=1220578 RepID=A0A0E9MYB9_9BACT|nr:hypothetical protein [Flavihumibacter petaseus]GAO42406.1 hypothetical protein FPE01S_01_14210 [Flavihumibacter petaseus NBRC 106054]
MDLALQLNEQIGSALAPNQDERSLRQALAYWVNELLLHDFNRLINVLYRVDVDEQKLKFLLKEKVNEDAAQIIADLLIERQLQKYRKRSSFEDPDTAEGNEEEERW